MKDLQKLNGAKILSNKEQQKITGGWKGLPLDPCGGGGEVLTRYTTQEECNGHGIWSGNLCWTCR
ncbi:hypothetical protein BZG01_04580 [Labilibaculum manganireducens]|uniref:Bacteriocin n=1 Tax=Labilibaculum manganireducens TaxID=1940525 RepID=A0A2N3IDT3_9BACT|nr:hypothetical protein [Labilibaculum manganireducens]PKQ68492.1 hypothetical protein BZG01_04580 [Labilibaculum manganireducens]